MTPMGPEAFLRLEIRTVDGAEPVPVLVFDNGHDEPRDIARGIPGSAQEFDWLASSAAAFHHLRYQRERTA